jgi:hypothetical protein
MARRAIHGNARRLTPVRACALGTPISRSAPPGAHSRRRQLAGWLPGARTCIEVAAHAGHRSRSGDRRSQGATVKEQSLATLSRSWLCAGRGGCDPITVACACPESDPESMRSRRDRATAGSRRPLVPTPRPSVPDKLPEKKPRGRMRATPIRPRGTGSTAARLPLARTSL